jgi:RNase H-like domain found in reverse transcriptase
LGKYFEVFTNHRTIINLMKQKNLKERQVRWVELLSEFDVKIQYKERVNNIVANVLSRRPDHVINGL